MDDVLDIQSDESGKTKGLDLSNGILTAPILFAIEEDPRLQALCLSSGDTEAILDAVRSTKALDRSIALAKSLQDKAIETLSLFPPSSTLSLLEALTRAMSHRTR